MSAGDIWFNALSNAGRSIGSGIENYRKQQDQMQSIDTLLQLGGQMTVPDPATGESKPVIDPKIMEWWAHHSNIQKAHAAGGIEALLQMQYGLAQEGAKARIHSDLALRNERLLRQEAQSEGGGAGSIVRIGGRTYRITRKGDLIPVAESTSEKATIKQSIEEQVLADPNANVAFGRLATPEDVAANAKKGVQLQPGQFTNQYADAGKGDMARIISSGLKKPVVIPRKQYEAIVKQRRPKPEHVAKLKANPTQKMRDYFDQVYGAGASDKALGHTPLSSGDTTKQADDEQDSDE